MDQHIYSIVSIVQRNVIKLQQQREMSAPKDEEPVAATEACLNCHSSVNSWEELQGSFSRELRKKKRTKCRQH